MVTEDQRQKLGWTVEKYEADSRLEQPSAPFAWSTHSVVALSSSERRGPMQKSHHGGLRHRSV